MTTTAPIRAVNWATDAPIIPHPGELVAGLLVFGILMWIFAWKISPRLEKIYADRANAIEGSIKRAELAQAEADRRLEQYREQLSDAQDEGNRIREEARAQGTQIVVEMREQAQAEAARITASAKGQLAAERRAAQQSLRAEIGGLATELASRIVGESLTDEARQRRTVDRFLAELEAAPAGPGRGSSAGPGAHAADSGQREPADA